MIFKKIKSLLTELRKEYHFVKEHKNNGNFKSMIFLQITIGVSFFVLSIANIVSKSYVMLVFTLAGAVFNLLFAFLSYKTKNENISPISTILLCSILFDELEPHTRLFIFE